jgi:uncharacterized protein YeaO (DUF488 family)
MERAWQRGLGKEDLAKRTWQRGLGKEDLAKRVWQRGSYEKEPILGVTPKPNFLARGSPSLCL